MVCANKKFEVSDPAFYDALISNQKKEVYKDAKNAAKWLELGRLQEAKVEMTRCFAEKNLLICWLPVMTFVLFFITCTGLYLNPSLFFQALSWKIKLPVFILCTIIFIFMIFARYPCSGSRYFRKVLSLDPNCAEGQRVLLYSAKGDLR
ncbi:MAG: hypothetical protein ABIK15_03700 [Pseudomonadota bacterium]